MAAETQVSSGIETALLHGLFPEPVLRRTLLKSVGAAASAQRISELTVLDRWMHRYSSDVVRATPM